MADTTILLAPGVPVRADDNGDGTYSLATSTVVASDIEIGAVEIKDATTDTRAVVGANGLYVDVRSLAALVAGEAHLGEVGGTTKITSVTFSADTSIFASGDVIADTQIIAACFRADDKGGVLHSLTLIDKDDQGAAMDVYFFDANVSMGSENSAPSISDANAASYLGHVAIATGDWKDLGGVKVAHIRGIGLPVKPASGTDDLYVAVVNGAGTPTFTASGLVGRVGILLD